ncbi:MAG: amidohydrolase family protein, partial [Proteobacteria bacterium]|nr:amidohydrolase family protein [Pseudomonadota bacterium]
WPVYETCQELAIPIIAHSGLDNDHKGFTEPRAFANMLKAFPHLRMVVAHLGGAAWKQTLEIAQTFPNTYFDCCEIIEWTNSAHGPTDEQLAQMIIDIGPERVMMGSDFPWYDLDHSIDRVFSLPLLSQEQKEQIIGANAVDILGL